MFFKKVKKKLLAVALIGTLLCSTALSGIAVAADGVEINADNFPDPIFLEYVKQFNTDGDNTLSQGELEKVTTLNLRDAGLTDIKGIEHFTNVTAINLSFNKLRDASPVDFSPFSKLESLNVGASGITEIDVSKNPLLKSLDSGEGTLKTLDVRNNTALESLNISYNSITELDLSNNTALKHLNAYGSRLRALDLRNNPLLETLVVEDSDLMEIDLRPDASIKTTTGLKTQSIDLGEIPSDGYNLKNFLPNLDFTKIKNVQGATINPDTGIMSGYTKDAKEVTYEYDTGNANYTPKMILKFTVKETDTDKYDLLDGSKVTKPYGEKATQAEIEDAIALVEAGSDVKADEANIKKIDATIPEPSEDGASQDVTVTVTYQDDTTDTTTVAIEYKKATEKFDPVANNITVNKGENPDAKSVIVDADKLPAATTYAWQGLDTNTAGEKEAKVLVTYPDNSTDLVTVTVTVVETTTPTETETDPTESTEPATEPTTDPTTPETEPTETETQSETKPATDPTEPTTEPTTNPTEPTNPVATSSNATKNGSKSSGSKKPSASTNGSVGPADNTNTNTTEPTANTNEAIAPANNANTEVTESLVNAAMKGMLPETGDMLNLNVTMAGLLGSLTGLVGLVASKKRK